MILPTYSTSIVVSRDPQFSNKEEKTLDVFLCFDEEFSFPTGVCAYSLLKNNMDIPINLHLVGTDVKKQSIDKFRELNFNPKAEVYFHDMDFSKCVDLTVGRKTKYFPLATFLRLLLPSLFPQLDKLLYLDGDTLCLNSLRELRDLDLKDNFVAAVKDFFPDRMLNSEKVSHYFNSGVLLINARLWREANLFKTIFDVLCSERELPAPDQDALNIAIGDKKIILDKKYNYIQENFPNQENDSKRSTDSVIVHYANRRKPWTIINQTLLYTSYRTASPWKGTPLPLAYKNDPNTIRRFAFSKLKGGNVSEGITLLVKYLSIEISRKKERWLKH